MVQVHIGKRGKYDNAKTGHYFPLNPQKYKGSTVPIYKSSLEQRMMMYLDKNPSILQWSYEPSCIRYYDPILKKVRRYFIDFTCVVKLGLIQKTVWIEVKPLCECKKPTNSKNINANKLWITNMAKWQAASQLAKQKGYEFHVVNESQLT